MFFLTTPSFPTPIPRACLPAVFCLFIQFSTLLLSQLQGTFSLPRLHEETLCSTLFFPIWMYLEKMQGRKGGTEASFIHFSIILPAHLVDTS